jgi:hypothetical protein
METKVRDERIMQLECELRAERVNVTRLRAALIQARSLLSDEADLFDIAEINRVLDETETGASG